MFAWTIPGTITVAVFSFGNATRRVHEADLCESKLHSTYPSCVDHCAVGRPRDFPPVQSARAID